MRLVFHSNFMNHHQKPLCDRLIALGVQVLFVTHSELPEERQKLGYQTYSEPYIVSISKENEKEIYALTMSAEAVIFGTKIEPYYTDRVQTGRMTFNYTERLFKKKMPYLSRPIYRQRFRKKYLVGLPLPYVLCAGSFVASDFACMGYPKDRFLKWGYFPEMTKGAIDSILQEKNKNSIVWVGRLISWKHPEHIISLAKWLKKHNVNATIKMIGTGPLETKIQKEITRGQLGDMVTLAGALSPEEVRFEMEAAQIALITSDRNEGWGAVVNEAMNSGCAVVSCSQIGSVKYLIQNGINGYTYSGMKLQELFTVTRKLLGSKELCDQIGYEAYQTIQNIWNYQVAAERVVQFIKDPSVCYEDGPMSKDRV